MAWREPALSEPLKSSDLLSPARLPGESYEEYKARRRIMKEAQKTAMSGRKIWDSKTQGTVRIREYDTPEKVEKLLRDAEEERRIRQITDGG